MKCLDSGNPMTDHHRMPNLNYSNNPERRSRKRLRARDLACDDEHAPLVVSVPSKGIKIGESQDVWNFYEQRFTNCQQAACKLIAKAWVKAIEPKKQSTYPYTGGDDKAPKWWPKPWGLTREDKVRHKEPDHLYKRGQLTTAISTT
ncbi:hypothetical protein AUP68_16932 [Ilyonectria robusta]